MEHFLDEYYESSETWAEETKLQLKFAYKAQVLTNQTTTQSLMNFDKTKKDIASQLMAESYGGSNLASYPNNNFKIVANLFNNLRAQISGNMTEVEKIVSELYEEVK